MNGEREKNLSTGIFILLFKSLSISKKGTEEQSHAAWQRGFFFPPQCIHLFFFFIHLFVFMLLSDAKRDVPRFETAAFACTAGRSEPLESD